MAEIKDGVWTMGDSTLMKFTNEIIVVGMPVDAQDEAIYRSMEVLRRMISDDYKFIVVRGGLSYQSLSECEPLVKLIDERVAQLIGKALANG